MATGALSRRILTLLLHHLQPVAEPRLKPVEFGIQIGAELSRMRAGFDPASPHRGFDRDRYREVLNSIDDSCTRVRRSATSSARLNEAIDSATELRHCTPHRYRSGGPGAASPSEEAIMTRAAVAGRIRSCRRRSIISQLPLESLMPANIPVAASRSTIANEISSVNTGML